MKEPRGGRPLDVAGLTRRKIGSVNPRYIETFSRHRVLFSLPLVVAVVFAIASVLGAPKQYESGASLYVDTPVTAQSSTDPTSTPLLVPPSTQEQQILIELLSTRSFRLKVGHQGPLAEYLAHHSDHGLSPTALLAAVRTKPSLDYRVMSALDPKHIITAVPGPQVLAVNFIGPSPNVAVGTLRALLKVYVEARATILKTRAQQSLSLLRDQVAAAKTVLDQAQANAAATSSSSPQYRSLVEASRVASKNYAAAVTSYHNAYVQASAPAGDPSSGSITVLDPPTTPAAPQSGKKKALMAIIAGLFVGGLLSFGGVAAFTRLGGPRGKRAKPQPLSVAATRSVAPVVVDADRQDARGGSRPASLPASETHADADADVLEEASSNGNVLKGTIIAVWDDGDARQARPVWTIRQPANGDVRLVPGNALWMVGDPGRQGVIRNLRTTDDGGVVCEVEITRGKLAERSKTGHLAIAPADTRWVGLSVAFVQDSPTGETYVSDGTAA
jgi:hypothetical protein